MKSIGALILTGILAQWSLGFAPPAEVSSQVTVPSGENWTKSIEAEKKGKYVEAIQEVRSNR